MPGVENAAQKFAGLRPYLPKGSFQKILAYFENYPIFLKITRERRTILGDYRHPTRGHPVHRISVNGTLNPYSFLVTLLHEMAHMLTYIQYGKKALPHGQEWQKQYREAFKPFLNKGIFPGELETVIKASLGRVKAATCSDPDLYRALKGYDSRPRHIRYVENIAVDDIFQIEDGRRFKMIGKLRTRYKCQELSTKRFYYFNAMVEVVELKKQV
ncbi:MAG TPA: SprT-like domain-containing protein [Edaphocola sp.]|nr:SprT-like domain-containing protein [Edaphocola sp.]